MAAAPAGGTEIRRRARTPPRRSGATLYGAQAGHPDTKAVRGAQRPVASCREGGAPLHDGAAPGCSAVRLVAGWVRPGRGMGVYRLLTVGPLAASRIHPLPKAELLFGPAVASLGY